MLWSDQQKKHGEEASRGGCSTNEGVRKMLEDQEKARESYFADMTKDKREIFRFECWGKGRKNLKILPEWSVST